MAILDELVTQIENLDLRARIAAEAEKLAKQKKYGLVPDGIVGKARYDTGVHAFYDIGSRPCGNGGIIRKGGACDKNIILPRRKQCAENLHDLRARHGLCGGKTGDGIAVCRASVPLRSRP